MKVSLSLYDLFLSIKGSKDLLEIFKEQSDEIRSIPPAVFFEKAVLKIFKKFLDKTFVNDYIFSIFANIKVGKYAEYRISLNKHWTSNKSLPLISIAPNSFKI